MTSESESEVEADSMKEIMGDLRVMAGQIDCISQGVGADLSRLLYRMKAETVTWMVEPLRPSHKIREWCTRHSLPANPTIDSFMDACFEAATSIDLETRMLTFSKEDAVVLWGGVQRLSIFDIVASIPTLFQ
jgi:hypothetical protein